MWEPAHPVVVTGGAGFIGSHLVDRLLSGTSQRVVVLDSLSRGRLSNLASHRENPRLQVIQGDVRDARTVGRVLRGADVVFHLAAQSLVRGAAANPEETFSTNVGGTFTVLQAAVEAGVKRFVLASSREVYGEPLTLPVDEDHPLIAISSYGASKAAAEAYCSAFRRERGLQTVILRLTNVYGPRDTGRLLPLWIESARIGSPLPLYGGVQVLDFIWVGDVVDALLGAAQAEQSLPPINVGSGTGTRIQDLGHRIGRLLDRPVDFVRLPARPTDVTRFVADVQRLRHILRVEPSLDPLLHLSAVVRDPVALAVEREAGEGSRPVSGPCAPHHLYPGEGCDRGPDTGLVGQTLAARG